MQNPLPTKEEMEKTKSKESLFEKTTLSFAGAEPTTISRKKTNELPTKTDPNPISVEDLDRMAVEELRKQQEAIDKRLKEKLESERKTVIQQIKNVVDMYKIPIDDLVVALGGMKIKRKGVRASPKYKDPETGVTWSGRGKEPLWIRGKNRDDFLIKK